MHCIFFKPPNADLKLTFYDAVSLINAEHWNKVTANKNCYLSLEYLQALEVAMQPTMEFRYIIFYNNAHQPVAAATVQLLNFSGKTAQYRELLSKSGIKIKYKLPESIDMKMMVCGNIFSCGENGFIYTDAITGKEAYETLANGLNRLKESEKVNGKVSFVLLKEFWPASFINSDTLKTMNYKSFQIDVNMILRVRKNWKTMEDYLADMTTKFRDFAPHFEDVFSAYEKSNDGLHRIATIKLLALMYQLKDFTTAFNQWEQGFSSPQQILLHKFTQLVNNYYIEKRTIEEYAQLLNVTANHLSQSVKSASGKNALSYINERIMTEARSLIQYTGFDIAEIAYQLNFSDPANFGKFFKKHSDLTPVEFRKQEIKK